MDLLPDIEEQSSAERTTIDGRRRIFYTPRRDLPPPRPPKTRVWERKKPRLIYGDMLLCLSALTFMAVWSYGLRALLLVVAAVLSSIFVDMLCCKMTGKLYNPRDLSTITAGASIVLVMPATTTYLMAVLAAALAIGIKHIFGGKNNYIFNPTATALAFLIICYPARMLLFPKMGENLPVFGEYLGALSSGVGSYLVKLGTAQELGLVDILIGNFPGPMGTTHVAVLLVCAVCLIFRRSVSVMVTMAAVSVTVIFASVFPLHETFADTMLMELIGGYLLFGLLFLANDPQTLPKTQLGKLYYGVTLGALIILFRYADIIEGSFFFALLAANALSLSMDSLARQSVKSVAKLRASLARHLSSYERFREDARTGEARSIYDTQEIVIDPINYDMPPIDNKVTKIKRKKPNVLTKTREKLAVLSEKSAEGEILLPPPPKERETIVKTPPAEKLWIGPMRRRIWRFLKLVGRGVRIGAIAVARASVVTIRAVARALVVTARFLHKHGGRFIAFVRVRIEEYRAARARGLAEEAGLASAENADFVGNSTDGGEVGRDVPQPSGEGGAETLAIDEISPAPAEGEEVAPEEEEVTPEEEEKPVKVMRLAEIFGADIGLIGPLPADDGFEIIDFDEIAGAPGTMEEDK